MAGFHKLAEGLLRKFGFAISAFNTSGTGFNIEAGKEIVEIDTEAAGLAAYIQLDTGKLKENGYLFKEGDSKLLVSLPLDFDFSVASILVMQGVNYKIAFMQEVKDVLETAVYKVVVREDVE